MKNETAILYFGLLVACLTAFVGVSSAYKCYQCDSKTYPGCGESYFVSIGIPVGEDCTCCTKYVSSSGTTRECRTAATAINCANPASGNHICLSDYCNGASHDVSRIAMATLVTSLMMGALITRFL